MPPSPPDPVMSMTADPAGPAPGLPPDDPVHDGQLELESADGSGAQPPRKRRKRRRRTALDHMGSAASLLFLVILAGAVLLVGLRFGAATPLGRAAVEDVLDGLRIPRFGHLVVEGIEGDPWRAFSARRVAIRDAEGEWITGTNVALTWNPLALLALTVDISDARSDGITILRRPLMVPSLFPDRDPPVATRIRQLETRLETLPAFSEVRGLWTMRGTVDAERDQSGHVVLNGDSLLQAGDILRLDLRFLKQQPIRIEARAREARGGAFAGAIGLNPALPFDMDVRVTERRNVGTIRILTISGGLRVTDVSGGWDRDGGRVGGQVRLDASRHTRWIAERLGAASTLDARWSRAPGAADSVPHRLAAQVAAPGGTLTLEGAYIIDQQRFAAPAPIRLVLPQTGPFIAVEGIEAGRGLADGTLSGTLAALRFQGRAEISALGFLGYRLGRIAGPLEIARVGRDLDITTTFTTSGGAGDGLIPALLGPAPSGRAVVRRLSDERILIRELDVRGAGVTLTGSGDRSFLGAVSMRGEARADAGRTGVPGLSGLVSGRWSLSQSAPQAPWRLELEGRGESLRLAEPRLDALVGARPQVAASLDITDAGLTFRSIALDGTDSRLRGTGSRTAGGLARLSGEVRLGARTLAIARLDGSIEGQFTATQPGENQDWTIGFTGRADRFSTGYGEIDRLFGSAPQLSGEAVLRADDILLTRSALTGQAARAGAIGRLGSQVALQLDWAAEGPFRAGALEASGQLAGGGTLTGPADALVADLRARIARLDLPQASLAPVELAINLPLASDPLSGRVSLVGTSPYGVVRGSALATAAQDGLALSDIDLAGAGVRAEGTARLAGPAASRADLQLALGPGLFLEAGQASGRVRIVDGRGAPTAAVALTGRGLVLRGAGEGGRGLPVDRLELAADGPLERLAVRGSASVGGASPLQASGSGLVMLEEAALGAEISLSGQASGIGFRTAEPLVLRLSEREETLRGALALTRRPRAGEALAPEAGRIDLVARRSNGRVEASAELERFALQLFSPDLLGSVTGTVELSGQGAQLSGNAQARLADVRSKGLAADLALNGAFEARLTDETLRIEGTSANVRGLSAQLDLSLPVVASAAPLRLAIDRARPMQGSYEARGEVRPVADLIFAGERVLAGPVEARGTVGGSLNAPQLTGTFSVRDGTYVEPAIGLRLTDLDLAADLAPGTVTVRRLSGRDGREGQVSGSGRIGLSAGGASTFDLSVRRFRLLGTDTAQVEASGTVQLSRAAGAEASRLTGSLRVDRAQFAPTALATSGVVAMEVEEINRPGDAGQEGAASTGERLPAARPRTGRAPPVLLDVALEAPRGIMIRGRGLNLELALDGRVGGSLAQPQLTGLARVYRGEFDYAGRVFVFDDRGTINLDADPERIRLNLVAERDVPGLVARIEVRGTAARPEITLGSTPQLPPDEILAQVLFGRSRAQLSPLEGVQLAAGLASLAGGRAFDIVGNLREFARLDRLVFTDSPTGISVAGGVYLGRDVFLELISVPDEGITSQVEWRPLRGTAITSRVSPDGDARISVRWRRDIR
jgi:autotransporter translocation and assembly factor TamB